MGRRGFLSALQVMSAAKTENDMEKRMEHEMETGILGFRV